MDTSLAVLRTVRSPGFASPSDDYRNGTRLSADENVTDTATGNVVTINLDGATISVRASSAFDDNVATGLFTVAASDGYVSTILVSAGSSIGTRIPSGDTYVSTIARLVANVASVATSTARNDGVTARPSAFSTNRGTATASVKRSVATYTTIRGTGITTIACDKRKGSTWKRLIHTASLETIGKCHRSLLRS